MINTVFHSGRLMGMAQHDCLDTATPYGVLEAEAIRIERHPYAARPAFLDIRLLLATFLRSGLRENKIVPDALMVTFKVVMSGILLEYMAKRPLAEENHSIQTFGFNR